MTVGPEDDSYIYGVTEQDMEDVVYIGMTRNPDLDKRLFYHLGEPTSALQGLKDSGKKLSIHPLETVKHKDVYKAERWWINCYLESGAKLLNRNGNPHNQKIKKT